jgi:DNA-binding GntR family transcriptional regulator
MTDRDTDVNDLTKYKRLAAEIRTWLDSGMFQPGEPLPSITDLAADRGWSRQTCAHVLQSLEAEGLLRRYPGFGYYVTAHQRPLGPEGCKSRCSRRHRIPTELSAKHRIASPR